MFKFKWSAIAALVLLMALTRFHHFGSALNLPDASLAVFFLAGLWSQHKRFFALLLLEAGLIDYLAITQMQVSDYCVSPAYVFLLPTYGVLWLAGRYGQRFNRVTSSNIARQLTLLIAATSCAYLLSSGSFYLFSGKFASLSAAEYWARTAHYVAPYLGYTLLYSIGAIASAKLLSLLHPAPIRAASSL